MRLGVLDIGSNTVHLLLLLIDAHPGAHPIPFASHKAPLQLVNYLDAGGAISEDGQRELVSFVAERSRSAASTTPRTCSRSRHPPSANPATARPFSIGCARRPASSSSS